MIYHLRIETALSVLLNSLRINSRVALYGLGLQNTTKHTKIQANNRVLLYRMKSTIQGVKMRKLFLVLGIVFVLLTTTTQSAEATSFNSDAPWNGYEDAWGNWVPGLITNDTWMSHQPQYTQGKMVFYGPGAMDATAEYRGIDYEEEGCIGGVSLMYAGDIGRKVWIKHQDEWIGPLCSVDSARRGDLYPVIVYRDEVVEINAKLAEELGMITITNTPPYYEAHEWYRDVEVWLPPADYQSMTPHDVSPLMMGDPIDFSEYFLETLEFATGWQPRVIQDQFGNWKEYGTDHYYDIEWSDQDGGETHGIQEFIMQNYRPQVCSQ
jgi:hypothetical protein